MLLYSFKMYKTEVRKMKVIKLNSVYDISCAAAEIIASQIKAKKDSVLGFATGASPVETYKRLIQMYENKEISFKDIQTFNLDEYCGLSKDNVNSYYYFMQDNLFGKVDVKKENIHFLSGQSNNIDDECEQYKNQIEQLGGIDIQLLGIGTNGHIGFNEPSDKFTDGPFKVKLTQSTVKSNIKYFSDGNMPEYALTMGVGDILRAKKIILIATGESKAKAVAAMVNGEVTPQCPASALQNHADVTVFVDEESSKLL